MKTRLTYRAYGEKGNNMGWNDDHRNAVADRWGNKFRESSLSPDKFKKQMKRTLKEYGWSENDIEKMVTRAFGKDDE